MPLSRTQTLGSISTGLLLMCCVGCMTQASKQEQKNVPPTPKVVAPEVITPEVKKEPAVQTPPDSTKPPANTSCAYPFKLGEKRELPQMKSDVVEVSGGMGPGQWPTLENISNWSDFSAPKRTPKDTWSGPENHTPGVLKLNSVTDLSPLKKPFGLVIKTLMKQHKGIDFTERFKKIKCVVGTEDHGSDFILCMSAPSKKLTDGSSINEQWITFYRTFGGNNPCGGD